MRASNRFLIVAVMIAIARSAAADTGEPLVQPIEGWLIGLLVLAIISILSRQRTAKSNARPSVPRGEH